MSAGKKLVEVMRVLVLLGLTNPRGGNGSIRDGSFIWLTPSGVPKHSLSESDLVVYDCERKVFIGWRKPTIEYRIHLGIYDSIADAKAILHAHLPLATSLSSRLGTSWLKKGFDEIDYSTGIVCLAERAPPGSIELARNVVLAAEKGCSTIIVPGHGVFTWSKDLGRALDSLIALENTAKYFIIQALAKGDLKGY